MGIFKKDYAAVYDLLYNDKDYVSECDYIETIFKNYYGDVKRVLDLGCGTGGHSLILAERGYDLVGVDMSKEMLSIAKSKVRGKNLSIRFVNADIVELHMREKFDAVISMFAVMSYQTTNAAIAGVCKTAREHLIPGGLFIFDCWNGVAIINQKPEVRVKEVELMNNERLIRFTQPALDVFNNIIEVRFKLWKLKGNHLQKECNEIHKMRYIFPQEIKHYLEVAGFREVKFMPFLKLDTVLSLDDWNMTVIAKL